MSGKPSDGLDAWLREDWRELGFYYINEDAPPRIRVSGSRAGLEGLATLLREYARNPVNATMSEHDHLGPYGLKLMTWSEAGIDANEIRGTLADVERLGELVGSWLAAAAPGDEEDLGRAWCPSAAYGLVISLQEDGFDPGIQDPQLQ
ncbi:MAG: hypothetical protein QNJ98_13570 [Planctomycetota bacterium]|nr:hypothetical protein [Planctomycetota bacterium]